MYSWNIIYVECKFSSFFMVLLVGWLVGWLNRVQRPFKTVFQSISGRLPEEGERREMIDERKMSKQPQPAPLQAQKALALL